MKTPSSPIFTILGCALLFAAFANRGHAATSFEFPVQDPPANKYWSSGEGAPFGNKLKITVEEGEVLAVTANEIIINRRKAKIKIATIPLDGWKYYFDKDSPLKEGTYTLDFSKEGVKKELAICTFYQDHDDSEEENEQERKVERIHAYLRVADLSVDSLNTHPYGGNDRSDDADTGENPEAGGSEPGKIIFTNANTTAAPDGRPGWADFEGRAGKETNFAHMDLFLQAFPEKTLVRFIYSGSDPAEVKKEQDGTWFLPEGHLRIWTKHGNQTRKPQAFTEGDYIPPSTEFSLEKLKPTDQGDGHYVFFVEAVRGSTQTADQTIKVQVKLPGGNWIDIDTVAFTLLSIDISFEKVGDNWEIEDNKDADGNWMPGKGKRIFVDAKTQTETNMRSSVYVKVKSLPPGWKIRLKSFDVDDPTPESLDPYPYVIDSNDTQAVKKGGDNRAYSVFGPVTPFFESNFDVIENCTVDAQGVARLSNGELPKLIMTDYAGDNVRVAVILVKPDGTPINGQDLSGLQVTDSTKSGYVPDNSEKQINGFCGGLSPVLTVWRKLNIEIDSMKTVATTGSQKNFEAGIVQAVTSGPFPGQTTVTVDILFTGPENRYEDGRLIVSGTPYQIVTNTDAYTNFVTGDQVVVKGTVPSSMIGQAFTIYDDDDNYLSELGFTSALPKNDLHATIIAKMRPKFSPAYIQVEDANAKGWNPNQTIDFELNSWSNALGTGTLDASKDLSGSDAFWCRTVVLAYQPEVIYDCDPGTENPYLGATPYRPGINTNLGYCVIFVETIRDMASYVLTLQENGPNEYLKARKEFERFFYGTIAHESAHVTKNETDTADHLEGGLMQSGNLDQNFTPQSIKRFRDSTKW